MPLPANFGGSPQEDLHHHYRNICIEFKKNINTSKEIETLDEELDKFINISKEVSWDRKSSDIYRKDWAEKAVNKVINEFRRYEKEIQNNRNKANPKDLLNAISEIEHLIQRVKMGKKTTIIEKIFHKKKEIL